MIRPRPAITLALLASALLITALPRTAAAAQAGGAAPVSSSAAPTPTRSSSSAALGATAGRPSTAAPLAATAGRPSHAGSSERLCSLSGLVRADGSPCPASGRLRRQWLGVPFIPNPVPVVKKVVGGVAKTALKAVALVVIVGWVASGAESALKATAKVIDSSTSPELTSSWFSASYWRIAGIAALLTLPFLCAAAIHAIIRSDLGLLTRAAFGYLPLSLLAVGIASQLTMLLLAGTDEMSSIIASASGHADGVFLSTTGVTAIAQSVETGDPFVAFLAAMITVAATLALWIELLVRDAAVYVIVLMLPLFFAAMVWPARRMLATRAIETLIALILSKFAIVAVLSLGGTALGHSAIPGPASVLTGATLVLLAAFSPWALLRMLPLHELASAAAGGLSQGPRQAFGTATEAAVGLADGALALGAEGSEWMRRALPEGPSSAVDGGRSTAAQVPGVDSGRSAAGQLSGADTDGQAAAGSSPIEPVDADLAEPVTSAMSGSGGNGAHGEAGADRAPSAGSSGPPDSGAAVGPTGDGAAGPGPDRPPGDTGSSRASLEELGLPGLAEGDAARLSLGSEMQQRADEQGLSAADADYGRQDPPSARTADPPAPEPVPPVLPGPDPIGPPPAAAPQIDTGYEQDEPSTPRVDPPPDPGFDRFGDEDLR